MSIVVGLAAFTWVWVAAAPFLTIASRWYRAARAVGAAPAFTTAFDRLVRGDLPRGPDPALRVLGPFAFDVEGARGLSFATRWALSLALMIASWLIGLPAILLAGPALLDGATGADAFHVFVGLIGLTATVSLAAYAAWRHLGGRAVAGYLIAGVVFVGLLLVPGTVIPALPASVCQGTVPTVLFFVVGGVGVASGFFLVYAPPSRLRSAVSVLPWLCAPTLLIVGSGCMNAVR